MSSHARITALGLALRNRRKSLRLDQQTLATRSGASVRFVRDLEHGKPTVRLEKVLDVCDALGLDIALQVKRPHIEQPHN